MFVTESYWNVIYALVYKSKDFFRNLFDRLVAIFFIVWLINMLYFYVVLS